MSTRLIVDQKSELHEMKVSAKPIKIFAAIISYIFHPVFIPVYIVIFLLYGQSDIFLGFSPMLKNRVLLQAFVPYVLFPVVTVLLLKGVGFISSVFLRTAKDRIIPYIACNIWYFWIWHVWRHLDGYPKELVLLSLAVFLASVFGFLVNIYMMISMHAIAVGVLVSFILRLAIDQPGLNVGVAASFFIAGLVCTARFLASGHSRSEVYTGLVVGVAGVLISSMFV